MTFKNETVKSKNDNKKQILIVDDEPNILYSARTLSSGVLFGIIIYSIAMGVSFVFIQLSVFPFTLILIPAIWPNKLMNRRKTNL